MRRFVFSMLVCVASVVAYIGIYPTSWSSIYQPTTPPDLLR